MKIGGRSLARREFGRDGVADMRQQLKNGISVPCILLYGEETFLVDRFVRDIRDCVLKPETRAFNEIVLDGRVKPEDIRDACETYPVFAERKLVIVRKSGLFKAGRKKPAAQVETDERDANETGTEPPSELDSRMTVQETEPENDNQEKHDWKPFFESLPAHTVLLFAEDTVNKTLGLYKLVDKYGLAAEMPFQKPEVLGKWIQKGFAMSGKQITPADADYLMHRSEDGMTSLHQEIGKVSMYMGDRTQVAREDIRAVVVPSIRSRVFDLMDAVAGGDCAKAFVMLDEMIQKREPESKIFYMLAKQAGRLLQLKRLGPGLSSDRKADRLGMNAYALSKMEKLAGRLSGASLNRFVQGCADMDMAVKGGRIKIRLALELLIAGLAEQDPKCLFTG
jgi:DNA polymerase III subunit delta